MGTATDLGCDKHLFIDHRFIAEGRDVELRLNPPAKRPGPILESDRPWDAFNLIYISLAEDEGTTSGPAAGPACAMRNRPTEGPRHLSSLRGRPVRMRIVMRPAKVRRRPDLIPSPAEAFAARRTSGFSIAP